MENLQCSLSSSCQPRSCLADSGSCLEADAADADLGFDEADGVWRTANFLRPARLAALVLELTVAVIPGTVVYVAVAVWNLALPYSLLNVEPFTEWPPSVQWAHIANEVVFNACCFLGPSMLLQFAFRSPAEARGLGWRLNFLITSFMPVYVLTMMYLSLWDPLSAKCHLPLNALFTVMLWSNAAAVAFAGGGVSGRPRRWTTLMVGLPTFLPGLTSGVIQDLLPVIKQPRTSSLQLGFWGSVGVPMVFMMTQVTARNCCMQLMTVGRHPGELSRLMVMALVMESFGRRVLICSITDPSYAFMANLVGCASDTLVQVTVDARDAALFSCCYCKSPGEYFEHQGRRRLRADALILHVLSEHLAILSLSTFEFAMRLITLQQPFRLAAYQYVLRVLIMLPVRIVFDVLTFALENRFGYITRRCFQLKRWHGIAVLEVWQKRKGELVRLMTMMALLAASYDLLYIIPFFKRALV